MSDETGKPSPSTEIIIPTAKEVRDLGLHKEMLKDSKREVLPDESYYRGALGPSIGPQVYKILVERAEHINQCLKNKDIRDFMKRFYTFVEKRAKALGYAYEDVELSPESGITHTGRILVKVQPKVGAVPNV